MLIQPLTPEILEKRRNFRRKILGTLGRVSRKTGGGLGRVWRKTRRGLFWTLVIGFIAHSALSIYASAQLNRELAAIRQRGEPLNFADMAPPALPDSQNAALIYKQAHTALHFSPSAKVAMETRESEQTPQMQRDIEIALKQNRRALDLTRRAAAMPRCVFPLDYRTPNPTGLFFLYYGEMRRLARTLSLEAKSKARRGDKVGALRDVRAIFAMGHHLSNEPVLIGYLVASAVDAIADQALAQVLESARFTTAELAVFKASLPATDWARSYRHSMMGERSWGVPSFENLTSPQSLIWSPYVSSSLDSNDSTPPRWIVVPLFWLWRPLFRLDEVHTLRLWRIVINSSEMQQVPLPPGRNILEKEIDRLPRYAMLTRILMPVFARSGFHRDRNEVRRRQREVALAIAAYQGVEGHLPKDLRQLPGGLADDKKLFDIYSQKPMIYRLKNEKFTLYSVGPNRKDDGGKTAFQKGEPGNSTADDIRLRNQPN